jgi:hypothetical protein
VTAAATGVIAGAAVLPSMRVLTNGQDVAIIVAAAVAFRLRFPEPLAMVVTGVVGAVLG